MRWLFFLMIFHFEEGPKVFLTKVFASEEECNTLGKDIERSFAYEDASLKSFSICIPENAYEDTELRVERIGE